jgi:adenylate cyclase
MGIAERMGPGSYASLLNRFYQAANGALVPLSAIVDKMIGDEVMAFFTPMTTDHRKKAVQAAVRILQAVGGGNDGRPWLPVGIGVHAGQAYVGRVGGRDISDLTALGDTVNTASRLQAEAKAGEIVLSEAIYADVADQYPDLEQRTLVLRGRQEPLQVRVLRVFD